MTQKTRLIGAYVSAGIIGLGLAYGAWIVSKHISYKFMYEDKVEQTVKGMYEARIVELEKLLKVKKGSSKVALPKSENKMINSLRESNIMSTNRSNIKIKKILKQTNMMVTSISKDITEGDREEFEVWGNTYVRMFIAFRDDFNELVQKEGYTEKDLNELFGKEKIHTFRISIQATLEVLDVINKDIK